MNHDEIEEELKPKSLSKTPFTVISHPRAELGYSVMEVLKEAFPRRKFELVLVRSCKLEIHVEGAYTRIYIMGPRSMQVFMGSNQYRSVSKATVVQHVRMAFDAETRLRKTQSHQRQQMKDYVERLQGTEMLDRKDMIFTVSQPTDDPVFIPNVEVSFTDLPDDVIAKVRFNSYRIKDMTGSFGFTVEFGNTKRRFESFAEVISFFNGNDVFKMTDDFMVPADFAFIKPGPAEHSPSLTELVDSEQVILVQRRDFIAAVPYLLLMQGYNFQIVTATVTPAVFADNTLNQKAMAKMLFKRELVQFVQCIGYPELQWKFDYANQDEFEGTLESADANQN